MKFVLLYLLFAGSIFGITYGQSSFRKVPLKLRKAAWFSSGAAFLILVLIYFLETVS